jgi:hypothetical protein
LVPLVFQLLLLRCLFTAVLVENCPSGISKLS